MNAKIYQVKADKLPGTDFREVRKKAYKFYLVIKHRSKRRPYIRSKYFKNNKIFLDVFWHHLFEKKSHKDQIRRMKFFHCAIELIKLSSIEPESKENPNKRSEILHRFTGNTTNKEIFYVQIKEDKKSGQKFLISIFPEL